jgi:hypothetical protein
MDLTPIKMAMEIRSSVLIMSCPIVVLAIIIRFYRGQLADHGKMIRSIAFIAIIVGCIKLYPNAVLAATDCVSSSSMSMSSEIETGLNNWAKSKIEGEDSTWSITAKVAKVMYAMSFSLSSIIRGFLVYFQRVLLYLLIALSPILLAIMLINETSSISVKFIMSTIGVILWSIGFNLSDMMIFSGWDAVMHAALTGDAQSQALAGTGVVATAATFTYALPILTLSVAFAVAFYFLVAILTFNILGVVLIMKLLHGGDPISASMGAFTTSSSIVNGSINAGRMGMQMSKKGKDLLGGLSKIGRGQGGI